jgi:aerobic-type carbon monoxide dehydrogenase small subunit (CoxS/CutS family)
VRVSLVVNGESCTLEVEPWETLVEVLRERMHLTGTKEGCGEGDCGGCIVLVDGRPVNSCLVLAVDVSGREVETIEGLAKGGVLHPLQRAFLEKGAVQCGFCAPGMILSAKALLEAGAGAGEEGIKRGLSGVLCRCGSYKKIVEAVKVAGAEMAGRKR